MILKTRPRAGVFAEQRYKRGLRSWQTTNRWLFAGICGPFLVIGIAAYAVDSHFIAWIGGLAAGGGVALWVFLRETPPRYVEKRRDGAEGERKAEKALKPLERAGWRVFHDIDNGRGNYDHIAVGTAGVYLLDSKNLQGVVAIRSGVPHLTRRHDPDEKVVFDRIRPHTLASAARLKKEIEQRAGHCPWVQAVVVFWSEFPEGLVEEDKCVFIHGSRLREWMRERPERLEVGDVEVIAVCIAGIAKSELAEDIAPVPAGLIPA
jgi:hypothetical protein